MHRHLPALNQRSLHRYRDEDARFADIAVIEKIVGTGLESIGVQQPPVQRDLYPKLVLLVALAMQRDKGGVVTVGKLQHWTGKAGKRRRLIEMAIKTAEYPVQLRDEHRGANPRIDCVLHHPRFHMRLPQA